ncbi:MAG: hypothetical protein ABIR84_05845, partial [Candidatus Nitrotoga sp.]
MGVLADSEARGDRSNEGLDEAATRRQPKLRCHDLCCIFVPSFSEGLILHTIVRTRQHEHNIFIAIALRPAVPDTSQ